MRTVLLFLVWLIAAGPAAAQDLTALARVLPDETRLEQTRNEITLTLALSQGVPYRVYTLDEPEALVIELSEVVWTGLDRAALAVRDGRGAVTPALGPGWSGLVLDLAGPFTLETSAMALREAGAVLTVTLRRVSEEAFAAASGLPPGARYLPGAPRLAVDAPSEGLIVLDPGHGGVDPGAERDGVREADLMLVMARELRDALRRIGGLDVRLTREEDVFVSLPARTGLARQLEATAFVSLHADALDQGYAEGATAYTLAQEATDQASALLAERHNRSDLLGGVDLAGQGDEIATILLDLARLETTPRSEALSQAILGGLQGAGARLNSNPARAADFAVLRSADVPSVLVEVGFLSSEKDRRELQSPERRAHIIRGLAEGIAEWVADEKATRALSAN